MLNFENLDKANFLGVGKYDTPIIQPEHIDVRHLEWIPFNFAKTCTDCATKGVHFFVDDYQFQRVWNQPDKYIPYKRLADYASRNPAWNMPSGYYDVQRKKQALESKKRSITNKIVTASRNVTVEKTNGKPFVNSFGEATKREITTTSYKNSQARLDKEIMGFVGGEINRKKQTKRRK